MENLNQKLSDEVLTGIAGGVAVPEEECHDHDPKEEENTHLCPDCGFECDDPGDLALHSYFAHAARESLH